MRDSPEYELTYLDFLQTQPIYRVLLPDTLGILIPAEMYLFVQKLVIRYPTMHFDFHAHNDYDLGVANVMEAIRADAHGVHLTVNGLGERADNGTLASVMAVLRDFIPDQRMGVVEKPLYWVGKIVETFSSLRIPDNKPVVGDNVFTQTAGIHADSNRKNNLYLNALLPERFGQKRAYALEKMSGKANIDNNLRELGIQLSDDDLKKVMQRVIELSDQKEVVTREGLPYIIADVLNTNAIASRVEVLNYVLTDYAVRIPTGGRTDALCETIITWKSVTDEFKTWGLDSDQTVSAIKATQKILNIL